MGLAKPFHRNFRGILPGPNAGYSGWAYIIDHDYAKDPEHYVRAYKLIQNDLQEIFEFVEPDETALSAYSYRIHALFMRTCIEVEANFRAILSENICTFPKDGILSIREYRKIDVTHHLSSYEIMLPIWNGNPPIIKPFEPWHSIRAQSLKHFSPLDWYQAYNASKHDRHERFKQANLGNLITAVAALLILLASQFRDEEFSGGSRALGLGGYEYHPMSASIGSLFRIKYPDDWSEDEMYDFNWSELMNETHRFNKINYDLIL